MDAIYKAWLDVRLSDREAIDAILYHPEYGGNRDDAEALVNEWADSLNRNSVPQASDGLGPLEFSY